MQGMRHAEKTRGTSLSAFWNPFDECTADQVEVLRELGRLIVDAGQHVNIVGSPEPEVVWNRHVVHSLMLAYRGFPAGATVVDWGTGGGFPALPLAIRFPEVEFVALDSVGKKIAIVRMIVRRLGLSNVEAVQARAEEWEATWDYSVSRATAPLSELWAWHERAARGGDEAGTPEATRSWRGRLMALKGGDLGFEIADFRGHFADVGIVQYDLGELTGRSFLGNKYIVEVGRSVTGGGGAGENHA